MAKKLKKKKKIYSKKEQSASPFSLAMGQHCTGNRQKFQTAKNEPENGKESKSEPQKMDRISP